MLRDFVFARLRKVEDLTASANEWQSHEVSLNGRWLVDFLVSLLRGSHVHGLPNMSLGD